MLHFIEEISKRPLPSFETADGLIDHFRAKAMFAQAAIDTKRADYHRALTQIAKAQEVAVGQDDVYEDGGGGGRSSRIVPTVVDDPTYEDT
mmetsp:Transcript_70534/g.170354  ORF Transcript_70534/g.170354 Transcript_70534/m.170354 type:complete len:91 (-) Transcript_70534:161-433(-)